MLQEMPETFISPAMPRPPTPKPAEPPVLIQMKLDAERVRALDALRKQEPDLPTRTDMFRRLLDRAAREAPRRK